MLSRGTFLFCQAALLVALAAAGHAGDRVTFTTVDGRVFNDVTVSRVVGRKLEVVTPAGPQLVRYGNLPRPVQERFFDASLLYPPKVGDQLDFTTLDGRAFKGPLREVTPNGISLQTPDGLEKIPYSNLPPELANSFDYDADDAAHYEAAMRLQQQRALAARQAAEKKAAAEAQRNASRKTDPRAQNNRTNTPTPAPMGERGTRSLGAPRLGGSGLGR